MLPSRWLMRWVLALALAWGLVVTDSFVQPTVGYAQSTKSKKKKRSKRRARNRRRKKAKEKAEAAAKAKAALAAAPKESEPGPDLEALKQELAAAKAKAEGRKKSKVTPGTASRWSNRGALTAVESEVQVTAPLPRRAVPVPMGAATPGQDLIGEEELLSARFAYSVYQMQGRGQDMVYNGDTLVPGQNRDVLLMRGRAHLAYERIAGSDFGVHLDLEYRPVLSGSRRADAQLNELYVSYGRTNFQRVGGRDWGIAAGRIAVREAGYAQADGLAFRLRLNQNLRFGAFVGLTGNPYGYNWRQRNTELFSTEWWTGGAFVSVNASRLSVNLATVVNFANVLVQPVDPAGVVEGPGLDRIYAYLDAAYAVSSDFNVLMTGYFDVLPGGQTVQNVEAIAVWSPLKDLKLRLGAGRFSTIVYELTTNYSYSYDPAGNVFVPNGPPIVDANGSPIIPFDGALFTTTYNQIKFRAGYRLLKHLDLWARVDTLIRDLSATNEASQAAFGAQVQFASLRLLPQAGLRYHNPKIIDASTAFTYVMDSESNVSGILRAKVGRGLYGFYLSADARYFAGVIAGADGGLSLSYTLPRQLLPGQLMVTASLRYQRLEITERRPAAGVEQLDRADVVFIDPLQETYMGFGGIVWRL